MAREMNIGYREMRLLKVTGTGTESGSGTGSISKDARIVVGGYLTPSADAEELANPKPLFPVRPPSLGGDVCCGYCCYCLTLTTDKQMVRDYKRNVA